jgi:hypothetical protein
MQRIQGVWQACRAALCGGEMAAMWRSVGTATGIAEKLTAAQEICDKYDTGAVLRGGTPI